MTLRHCADLTASGMPKVAGGTAPAVRLGSLGFPTPGLGVGKSMGGGAAQLIHRRMSHGKGGGLCGLGAWAQLDGLAVG